jgi:hypothetical protein
VICRALQMADVPQQVALSLTGDFENFAIFKPRRHNADAMGTLLDQVVASSTTSSRCEPLPRPQPEPRPRG